MKKFLSIVLVLVLAFSLAACSGGISREKAKTDIEAFWTAIRSENFDSGVNYLHPDHPGNAFELRCFIRELEQREGVLFSSMVIEKYTGFQSSLYNTEVGGSEYSLTMNVSVSGKQGKITTALAKNDNGYGIHKIEIEIGEQHVYF